MVRDELRALPQACRSRRGPITRAGWSSRITSQGSRARPLQHGRAEVPRRQREALWRVRPEGVRCDLLRRRPTARLTRKDQPTRGQALLTHRKRLRYFKGQMLKRAPSSRAAAVPGHRGKRRT